ncbi:hypothetical protein EBR57_02575, partial [bacterium]|nr:hypothetical protein [bacterium]
EQLGAARVGLLLDRLPQPDEQRRGKGRMPRREIAVPKRVIAPNRVIVETVDGAVGLHPTGKPATQRSRARNGAHRAVAPKRRVFPNL